MKVGTKSVLFGAHCFFLHPWFVAAAWTKLYGFPRDPRLWVAFFIHDLGYFGKPNMDGPEGGRHVEFGAAVMRVLFGWKPSRFEWREWSHGGKGVPWRVNTEEFNALLVSGWEIVDIANSFTLLRMARYEWSDFCLYHSRYYAKKDGAQPSRLCIADKLAIALTPGWLYLPMARMSGEIREYLKNARKATDGPHWKPTGDDARTWYRQLRQYMRDWVREHKDGRVDTWTSSNRHARDVSGVWQ